MDEDEGSDASDGEDASGSDKKGRKQPKGKKVKRKADADAISVEEACCRLLLLLHARLMVMWTPF